MPPYANFPKEKINLISILRSLKYLSSPCVIAINYINSSQKKLTPIKQNLFILFKKKRNLIITLLRPSKSDYFATFFEEHKNNAKRTWDGIRDTSPNTLIYNNKTF